MNTKKIQQSLQNTPIKSGAGRKILAIVLAIAPVVADAGDLCTVRSCHDGDTCTVICDAKRVKVRLNCIDAPELKQAPWGAMSRDALNRQLKTGSQVELIRINRDRYGRTVGVLLLDGVNINLNQVQTGWAATYPKYCTDPVYDQMQQEAREQHRGIWQQESGLHQRPWEWRAEKRQANREQHRKVQNRTDQGDHHKADSHAAP